MITSILVRFSVYAKEIGYVLAATAFTCLIPIFFGWVDENSLFYRYAGIPGFLAMFSGNIVLAIGKKRYILGIFCFLTGILGLVVLTLVPPKEISENTEAAQPQY